jgi:hypothetical protein
MDEKNWIPVSERLPEQYKQVLTTAEYESGNRCLYVSFLNFENRWIIEDTYIKKIVAWMDTPVFYDEKRKATKP